MLTTGPTVSVVIPVYNGSDYVGQAIESVLAQTYRDREIIVVNDGSTDQGATRQAVLAYGDRLRYIEKENGGVASALNLGIRAMRGEYFAWLSHDDLFCREKLSRQMERILASGSAATIAQGNCTFFSQETQNTVSTDFQKYYPLDRLTSEAFSLFWGELHFSTLLFHKCHFDRVGFFREDLATAQDNDFIFRLFRGQSSVFEETPVSRVRVHQNAGTSRKHELVDQENRALYLSLAQAITREEARALCGAPSVFLCKVAGIIKSKGGGEELPLVEALLRREMPRDVDRMNYEPLQERWGNAIIFGAGQYGIRLKYELNARGIYPQCFIDNAPEKAGKVMDGIPCRPAEYARQAGDAEIILAQKLYGAAYAQLKNMGIKRISLKDEVDADLLNVEPYRIER